MNGLPAIGRHKYRRLWAALCGLAQLSTILRLSAGYMHQHFTHRSTGQSCKCGFHILEWENTVDYRAHPDGIKPSHDLLPCCLGRFRSIVRNRDTPDPIPPEEQRCRVELRHGAAAPADNA